MGLLLTPSDVADTCIGGIDHVGKYRTVGLSLTTPSNEESIASTVDEVAIKAISQLGTSHLITEREAVRGLEELGAAVGQPGRLTGFVESKLPLSCLSSSCAF